MSTMDGQLSGYHGPEHGFPWKHLVGLILSIGLTLAALGLVLAHGLSRAELMAVVMLLAVVQIAVQLIFFMHFTESVGPKYHITGLALGLFFAFCVVAGSIWIMTFGGYEAY